MQKKINGEWKILAGTGAAVGLIAASSGLIGCSPMQYNSGKVEGYDYVQFSTAAGIKAQGDLLNGLIRTAKESRKDDSKYFGYRETEDVQITAREAIRASAPKRGLIPNLFGRDDKETNNK